MAHLSLSLLGPFQATLDGVPIAGFEANKVRALLAYLALEAYLHRHKRHPRQSLAALLWPDRPDGAALANLRNALANLRTAIRDRDAAPSRRAQRAVANGASAPPPFLQITRAAIGFDLASDHWLDVAAFEALVQKPAADPADPHRLQEAVALYRGDFLQGFSVRDSPEFEQWVLVQRERLHTLALEAWGVLAAYHEERGAYQGVIACARQQVALEPWHEDAHRRWMRALALSGQRGVALAQYAACCQVLADELGIEPEPATTALFKQIRDGTLLVPLHVPLRVQEAEPHARNEPSPGQSAAGALPLDPSPDGERRTLTVVRAHLDGVEDWVTRVGMRAGEEAIRQVWHTLAAEAARFGGEVDPRETDGLIACFGATMAHEDDPERAVLAALAMLAAWSARRAELGQGHAGNGPARALRLHLGVHTGQVAVAATPQAAPEGTSRPGVRALAARVQAAAPDEVWVSEATRRLVKPLFQWSPRGEVRAGPGKPVLQAYCALGRKASRIKMRGIAGLSSPLIGRDAESQALQAAVERLKNGVGGIITLVGEAGIGKSRLIAETRRWATGDDAPQSPHPTPQNLKWIEGRCLSYATQVAYQVWVDALHDLLGLAASAPLEATADALRERVHALCAEMADDVHPFLAQMMSLPLSRTAEVRLRGLAGEGFRELCFRAIEVLFECAARQSPLAVVCEDLHWADATSLELLARLLALTDRAPILWICVFRPETEHGCWQIKEIAARRYTHRHTDLWLGPLSAEESAQLVGCLLDVTEVPDALRSHVLDRAEGNPFYVEEILRSWIDAGVIAYDPAVGHWHTVRAESAQTLPDTLRGVLMARVDGLPRETRQVLQLASVVGRTFSQRVLEAICSPHPRQGVDRANRLREDGPGTQRFLDAHLLALLRAQMVREVGRAPEATYAFEHQLILEAAYDSLLPRRRRVLHGRVAEVLERLLPEHVEDLLGLLAHHWERAGHVERAVSFLRRAGERAAAQFANPEAVAYLSRALKLVGPEDPATRYALLLAREGVYDVQGARQAQQEDLTALAETAGDPRQRAEVAWRQARCAEMTSDHPAAIAAAREAVRLAQLAQDAACEAAARLYWGMALTYLEERQAARLQCEQALALAQAEKLHPLQATLLHWLGRIAMFGRDHAGSRAYCEQALEILAQIGDRRGQAMVLVSLCSTYRRMEDYGACRACGERALRLLRETGERTEEGWLLLELGKVGYTSGDYATARAYWEPALAVLQETGTRSGEAWALEHLGWIARDMGDHVTARDYLEQALPLFRQIGEYRSEGRVLTWLGLHVHELGEHAAALAYTHEALSLGRRTADLHMQATALTFEGYIRAGMQQYDRAEAAFRQALSLRHGFNSPSLAAGPLTGLADLCLARGETAQALPYVQEILETAKTIPSLAGLFRPFPIYMTLHRVLEAHHDPRAAEVLQTAHRVLLARAATFEDEERRRAYLENVPAHREIVALWERATYTRADQPRTSKQTIRSASGTPSGASDTLAREPSAMPAGKTTHAGCCSTTMPSPEHAQHP